MEKEEAVSLREAMDAMDSMNLKDEDKDKDKDKQADGEQDEEETRIYNAALDEAAELVWQHQHGVKPPEPGAPYRYKSHLRKNSYAHARTASAGLYGDEIGATGLARDSIRSFSGSSTASERAPSPGSPRASMEDQRTYSMGSTKSKSYGALRGAPRSSSGSRRLSSLKRNISGEVEKPFSGDQIWEEPENTTPERNPRQPRLPETSQPQGLKSRGIPNKVQFAPTTASDSASSLPSVPAKPVNRYEIHKNPPSQSRNPAYTTNSPSNSPRTSQESLPTKNGMEIRSEDIRQATSMRLKDRSPKLPIPSAVSDSPGRPIKSPAPSPAPVQVVPASVPAPVVTPSTLVESDLSASEKSVRVHSKTRSRLCLSLLSQLRRIFRPRSRRQHQQHRHGILPVRRPSQVFR